MQWRSLRGYSIQGVSEASLRGKREAAEVQEQPILVAPEGMGCNPAERVSPHRFAEPHPQRSQVIHQGRFNPHHRSAKR